jgi:hypothetical protein
VLGLVALLCASASALAHSDRLRSHYAWPPQDLPANQPDRLWYTPLLLSRHQPETVSVNLPCALPPPLQRGNRRVVVLETTRNPSSTGGLSLVQVERRVQVSIGGDRLQDLELPARAAAARTCAYRLDISATGWSITGGPQQVDRNGGVAMPVVNGLFSELDLRAGRGPSVEVTTTVYATRSTAIQTAGRILGALAAFAALVLVAVPIRTRIGPPGRALAGTLKRIRAPDIIVGTVLLTWWIVGPAFFDDGWVTSSQKNLAATGNLSSYYDSFAVPSSLQYWLVWLEHWLYNGSSALLVLRLPALVCLAAIWVLCRWILSRTAPARSSATQWALAAGFLVGALAWGMTLRPEPVLALLVAGVLACAVAFNERGTPAPLATAAVLIAFALSAHPAGLVTLAPLIVIAPKLFRWLLAHRAAAGAIVCASVSLLVTLVVLGSDAAELRANTASLRTYGQEVAGWREEIHRYDLLSRDFYGAPLRREWVALSILTVVAFLLRRRRTRNSELLDLPAAALGIGLVLLVATPSKLPWHFGTLLALAAVAIAAETGRLRDDANEARGRQMRPLLVIAAAVVAAAWSWSPRNTWSDLDLRTLSWTIGLEQRISFAKLAAATPLLLLGVFAAWEALRRRRGLPGAAWRTAIWTAPLLAAPLIAFTIGVLVVDALKTSSWTLTRQNLQTLGGHLRCGLADDLVVPDRGSMRALPQVGPRQLETRPAWLPQPPGKGLNAFAIGPPPQVSRAARSPWFAYRTGQHVGFFLTGTPGSSDRLELEWGHRVGASVTPVAVGTVPGNFGDDAQPENVAWRFYAAGDLPDHPAGADAVRFALRTDIAPGTVIGLTPPVTYRDHSVASTLARQEPVLALPNLRMYVPCIKQPRVAGAADAPRLVIAFRNSLWPLGTGTSPFDGLPNLYRLIRLPLSDSTDPPGEVALYEVDRHIDGGVVAPPVQSPSS